MLYGRIVGLLAMAMTTSLLIAGCGSDEGSEVTKAQFTKEAEAICADRKKEWEAKAVAYNEKLEAEGGKLGREEEEKQNEAFLADSLIPTLQAELEALEDLDVPEADEARIEKLLQSRAQTVEALEDKGMEALLSGDTFRAFEKEAKAYGLDCSLA